MEKKIASIKEKSRTTCIIFYPISIDENIEKHGNDNIKMSRRDAIFCLSQKEKKHLL